jgi:hypothetical protein
MVGIDAAPLAGELARRLDWPVLDRELLERMAGHDTTRRRLYSTMDGRDLGWAESVLRPLLHGLETRDDYFHRLVDTVLALARQAPAIFVGRGEDLVLPRADGFRVRLVATRAHRLASFARRTGRSAAEAGEELARVERERREYVQHHFRVEPDDPVRFDLALNVERWETPAAAALVIDAYERRRGGALRRVEGERAS